MSMIPGHDPREVASYLPIDRTGEGYCHIKPKNGEVFVGIPHNHYADGSRPVIEVWVDETLIRTVNCDDVSEICFVTA